MNEQKLNLKNTFVELDLYENAINKLEILSSRVWKANLNLKAGNLGEKNNEDFVFGKILLQYNFVKQRLYIFDVIADQISQVKNDLERDNQNAHDQFVVRKESRLPLWIRSLSPTGSNRSLHKCNGNIKNSGVKLEYNQDHGDSNQQIDDFKPQVRCQNAEKCKGDSWFNDRSFKTPTDKEQRELREPKKRFNENYNILASKCCEEDNYNKIDSVYCSSIRTVGYDPKTMHPSLTILYNNPFDPRLKFQGLHLQTIKSYRFKEKGFANENLFLAVPNISNLIEQHITISGIKLKMLSEEENNLTESEKSWLRSSHLFDDICRNEDVEQIIREPHVYTSRYRSTEAERRVMEPLFSDRTRLIWYAPEIYSATALPASRQQQPTPRRYRPGPVRRPPPLPAQPQQPQQQPPADSSYCGPAHKQNETSEQTASREMNDDERTSSDELDMDLNCISMEMDSNMEPDDDAALKQSIKLAGKILTQKDNGRANEKKQTEKELVQNHNEKDKKTENYFAQQTREPKHNIEKASNSTQKSSHCLAQTMATPMNSSTSISSPNRKNTKSKTSIQLQPSYASITNPKQTTQIDEKPEQKTINGPVSFSQNKSQVNIPIMNLAGEPMFQSVDANLRPLTMNLNPPIYRLPPSLPQLPHDVQFRQQAFSNQSYPSVMCNLGAENSKPALSTCIRNPPPGFAPLMNRFIIPTFPSPPSFSYNINQGSLNSTSQNNTVENNDSCTKASTHQEQDVLKGPLTSTPKSDQEGRQKANKIENFTPISDTNERNCAKQVPSTFTAYSQLNTLSPVSHLINQQNFKGHVPQLPETTSNNPSKIESGIKGEVYNQDKNNLENCCFSKTIGIQQDPKQVSVSAALNTEQSYKQIMQNQVTFPQFSKHEPISQQTTHNIGTETCQSVPNFFTQTPFQQPNFPKSTMQNGKSSGIGHSYNISQEKQSQICESQGKKTNDYFNSVNFANFNPNVQNLQTKNIATSIQEIFQGIKQR